MSTGEIAENVYRALLKELGTKVTEEQVEGATTFKSEECKFTLSVHRGGDGSFDKAVLEKPSEGEEGCKKFAAVVDALAALLKAFPRGDKPKDEEKSEEKPEAEANEEEKKEEVTEEKEKAEEEKPAE